jgi:hypothetical protein
MEGYMKVERDACLNNLAEKFEGDNETATIAKTKKLAYRLCVKCGGEKFSDKEWKQDGFTGKESILSYRRLVCAEKTCKDAMRQARKKLLERNILYSCFF